MTRDVLISGAGVAGSTLAYWLKERGFRPTVVERAAGLRVGGQAVDFRGAAFEVLERTGVLDAVRAHDTGVGDCTIVDRDGARFAVMPSILYAGELEVLIDDLIRIMYDAAVASGVEYVFGDSITGLAEDTEGVTATFERGAPRRFDLVIGADGAHSNVRGLAFGPEAEFAHDLGCYYGYFTLDNDLGLDHEGVATSDMATAALSVFSIRHDTQMRVGLIFRPEKPLAYDRHDLAAQKRLMVEHSRSLGWEAPRLMARLEEVEDLYFDAMTQIRMPSWSRGRIGLVGDAGYCAAPTSGRGTSQALVGAYVLAGELAAARDRDVGHRAAFGAAFEAYESRLREFVATNHAIGEEGSRYVFAEVNQEIFDALAEQARAEADVPEEDALKLPDY